VSVMPNESVTALNVNPDGIYVDGTLGGGGHSEIILKKLKSGMLIGIDRDETALAAAASKLKSFENFVPIRGNFHDLPEILQSQGISAIDGLLLDLGVSSHQIDTPNRGFSFRFDGPLDMRMDMSARLTARDIVNNYTEKDLANILYCFGEERHSRRIAKAITKEREEKPIETTKQLADIIEGVCPPRKDRPPPSMRSFMALRIAVNNELEPLKAAIENVVPLLKNNGRIAVITFHSLEDRIVKSVFVKLADPCECPRDIPYCVCGKKPMLRVITKKPITPGQAELEANSRAHSAKLRIAERII